MDKPYLIFCQKRTINLLINIIGRWDVRLAGRLKTAFSGYFSSITTERDEKGEKGDIILGALMGYVFDFCAYINARVSGDTKAFQDAEDMLNDRIQELLEEDA